MFKNITYYTLLFCNTSLSLNLFDNRWISFHSFVIKKSANNNASNDPGKYQKCEEKSDWLFICFRITFNSREKFLRETYPLFFTTIFREHPLNQSIHCCESRLRTQRDLSVLCRAVWQPRARAMNKGKTNDTLRDSGRGI